MTIRKSLTFAIVLSSIVRKSATGDRYAQPMTLPLQYADIGLRCLEGTRILFHIIVLRAMNVFLYAQTALRSITIFYG